MILSVIVAISKNNAIGRKNQLPWHLPVDLKHFKELTTGKPIIMGRNTWESIGKPLPNRQNVVITSKSLKLPSEVTCVHSFSEALRLLPDKTPEACIIGGVRLFSEALPVANLLHLTRVNADIADADVFFPYYDITQWQLISTLFHPKDAKNQYDCIFETYIKT